MGRNERLLTVALLRAHREGIHDAAAQRFEYGVESRRREAILELEFHFEMHAAAALANGIEAPRALKIAKGSVREAHVNLRAGSKRIARGEFGLQDPMCDFQHGDAFRGGNILHPNPNAPR